MALQPVQLQPVQLQLLPQSMILPLFLWRSRYTALFAECCRPASRSSRGISGISVGAIAEYGGGRGLPFAIVSSDLSVLWMEYLQIVGRRRGVDGRARKG